MEVARDGDSRYLLACSECDVRLPACLPGLCSCFFSGGERRGQMVKIEGGPGKELLG